MSRIERDFSQLDAYLAELAADVYPQPPDEIHESLTREVLEAWMPALEERGLRTVLDVGCGQGLALPILDKWAKWVAGVTLTADAAIATKRGFAVWERDMTFLAFHDEAFDLIYSRHVLEHSPMPLITLMEWHRVAKDWLILILPKPAFWGYGGRNHYSVMEERAALSLLLRAGWEPLEIDHDHEMEYRWLCIKAERRKQGDPWPPKPWDLPDEDEENGVKGEVVEVG